MTPKKKKPKTPTATLPHDLTAPPYDPLDLRTLAESMVKVVLEQKIYPLNEVPSPEGAGVYVIYYTGGYEPYRPIAERTKAINGSSRYTWARPHGRAAEKEVF
jgi:hypothetical protein